MRDFFSYIKRHPVLWVIVFLYNCLCHGATLLSPSSGIDVDVAINGDAVNGLDLGRHGFFLVHHLLGNGWFNLYYAGAMTLIFLTLACVCWSYLYVVASGRENVWGIALFSGIFLAGSTLTMHLYFKNQSMETAFGLCLLPLVVLTLMQLLEQDKVSWKWLLLMMPTVVLFSTYQSFLMCFIFAVVSYLFLRFQDERFLQRTDAKKQWDIAVKSGVLFVISFVVNQVLTSIIAYSEGYLTSQIMWGKEPVIHTILHVGKSICWCLLGFRPYFTATMAVFYVLVLIVGVRVFRGLSEVGSRVLYVLIVIGLLVSPFALHIILGQTPALRAMLAYPLFLGFMGFYVGEHFPEVSIPGVLLKVVCVLCLISQFAVTQRLNYTDHMRYAADVRRANDLVQRIDAVACGEDYPVAFYGHVPTEPNDSCLVVTTEPMTVSVFDWDWSYSPKYYYSSIRIRDFMRVNGTEYEVAPVEWYIDTIPALAEDMPVYPADGSVQLIDGLILIKLGEDDPEIPIPPLT